jgi:hypothetical protein
MALPLAVNAQTETTCILSATSDVYVEIHDYAEERKEETTWSGNISSGGEQSVRARGGEILIEWRDLTEDNPRTQNRREICNGNTILVP